MASGSGLALAAQFEQRRNKAGFQTVVFGLGADTSADPMPVVISATDISFGQAWELRTSGLWTEQIRERSFEHWSYGLEAFALAIDEPDELVRRAIGYRVPLGWELEFVATGPPEPANGDDSGSFVQSGTIDGLVLSGDGEQPISGPARRSLWIDGRPDNTTLGDDFQLGPRGDCAHPGSVILPTMYGPWTVERSRLHPATDGEEYEN